MYTTHGHFIEGTIKFPGEEPEKVVRCGGPGLCDPCSTEAWFANRSQTSDIHFHSSNAPQETFSQHSDDELRLEIVTMVFNSGITLDPDRIIESSTKLYNFIRNINN